MQLDVVILGASGYGGGELLRWLSQHPTVRTIRGTSRSRVGKAFHDAHPNLRKIVSGTFEPEIEWRDFASSEQLVVFSALPHGELAKTYADLQRSWRSAAIADRLLLIDLSADFRLGHPDFVYGMPEWNRAVLAKANRIACAGCFATALQLALLPLRDADVGFVAASAVTGSSGSGAAAIAGTHHPTRATDFRAYKILTHQHAPEVEMAMRANRIGGQLSFVPQSGPFVRGIFATIQFVWPNESAQLHARVQAKFADEPFVRLVEQSPRVAAVAGSNFADLAVTVANGAAAISVALDNLGKGMSGQAVQCMNLALGLPETTALLLPGRFPA